MLNHEIHVVFPLWILCSSRIVFLLSYLLVEFVEVSRAPLLLLSKGKDWILNGGRHYHQGISIRVKLCVLKCILTDTSNVILSGFEISQHSVVIQFGVYEKLPQNQLKLSGSFGIGISFFVIASLCNSVFNRDNSIVKVGKNTKKNSNQTPVTTNNVISTDNAILNW